MRGRWGRAVVLVLAAAIAATALAGERDASTASAALPAGFQEQVVFSGLTHPMAFRFASDGRVFVAEKSGLIKVFDGLTDTTPTVFADLRTNVHNFWDRGILGFALDPNFPANPYVYVLYTHDAAIGGIAPRWGTPGATSDPCPNPPGATSGGCVASGRLSRLQAQGNTMVGSEQVLVEDWCQQYPSHSLGALAFGPDGALYASAGDAASFTFTDYGQNGSPPNPCGDPPGGAGTALAPPSAEGGSLRSQDVRTMSDPTGLDGTIIRVNPATGAGFFDNPMGFSLSANARRIVAYGLRNPFRFVFRPGTSELWIGDVGHTNYEEINRLLTPNDTSADNFGWPCYEGPARNSAFDNLNLTLCESLYSQGTGAHRTPFFTYPRLGAVKSGDGCTFGTASISGITFQFYSGGSYPADYDGALFFADYSRDCIWAMQRGTTNLPDPSKIVTFVSPAANPVDLQISPAGEVWYADFDGGTIRRIRYGSSTNRAPTAVAAATPTSGSSPLAVQLDGTASSDPDGDPLTYAWDLDGDGAYDDSNASRPTATYNGTTTVGLRVNDPAGASDTDAVLISVDNTPPVATIASPTGTAQWKVGDTISFSGSAQDAEDGPLAASRLSWTLLIHHCPSACHTHSIESFAGAASGSFTAPDHEYPSHLELRLTATDSAGLTDTESVLLHPAAVDLTFATAPAGLQLTVGSTTQAAPFTKTVIVGSANTVTAPSPQSSGGRSYAFTSWSDGGGQTHTVIAPASPATYTATYSETASGCPIGQFEAQYFNNTSLSGTPVLTRCEAAIANSWGSGGPGNGVSTNSFSVRWTGTFDLAGGVHLFEALTDDGMRVRVDGTLLINQWTTQYFSPGRYRASRTLTPGLHQIQVEYFEGSGNAVAHLRWNGCASGYVGQYYTGTGLSGWPAYTRCEPAVNFSWGLGGPGSPLGSDSFSARWTTRRTFAAGSYRFTARASDGIRVYLDGALIIDQWRTQLPTTFTTTRSVTAGEHEIRVQYYESTGEAVAQVSWAPA